MRWKREHVLLLLLFFVDNGRLSEDVFVDEQSTYFPNGRIHPPLRTTQRPTVLLV